MSKVWSGFLGAVSSDYASIAFEYGCLHRASNFVAVGITIANCKKSASHGTIIVRSRSVATLKHVRIEDNRITGVYISKDASVTLHDAYFSRNTVVGNGAAIHSKGNAYVTITNSTFKGTLSNAKAKVFVFLGSFLPEFL